MIKTVIKVGLLTIPISYTAFDNIGYICRVEGNSMKPLITHSKDHTNYIFLSRWGCQSYDLNRGEVVCLICPTNPKQRILKRIIGLEGDTIKTLNYKDDFVKVPKGHCWVEGDNHRNSLDSNTFGPVPVGLVHSRATHLVWPRFLKVPRADVINRIKSHVEQEDLEDANLTYQQSKTFFIKSVKSGQEDDAVVVGEDGGVGSLGGADGSGSVSRMNSLNGRAEDEQVLLHRTNKENSSLDDSHHKKRK